MRWRTTTAVLAVCLLLSDVGQATDTDIDATATQTVALTTLVAATTTGEAASTGESIAASTTASPSGQTAGSTAATTAASDASSHASTAAGATAASTAAATTAATTVEATETDETTTTAPVFVTVSLILEGAFPTDTDTFKFEVTLAISAATGLSVSSIKNVRLEQIVTVTRANQFRVLFEVASSDSASVTAASSLGSEIAAKTGRALVGVELDSQPVTLATSAAAPTTVATTAATTSANATRPVNDPEELSDDDEGPPIPLIAGIAGGAGGLCLCVGCGFGAKKFKERRDAKKVVQGGDVEQSRGPDPEQGPPDASQPGEENKGRLARWRENRQKAAAEKAEREAAAREERDRNPPPEEPGCMAKLKAKFSRQQPVPEEERAQLQVNAAQSSIVPAPVPAEPQYNSSAPAPAAAPEPAPEPAMLPAPTLAAPLPSVGQPTAAQAAPEESPFGGASTGLPTVQSAEDGEVVSPKRERKKRQPRRPRLKPIER